MDIYREALEKLCKWRSVFAGWQLGTSPKEDAECQAVRDYQEARLIMRAEMTAITGLLVEKEIITREELQRAVAEEAEHLSLALEKKFPGFKATTLGMKINPALAAQTTRGWKP